MEKVARSRIADLDRKKFLVPSDLTGNKHFITVSLLLLNLSFHSCTIYACIKTTYSTGCNRVHIPYDKWRPTSNQVSKHAYKRCTTAGIHYSASMINIYHQHKDGDGFLYVAYSGENTMGGEN